MQLANGWPSAAASLVPLQGVRGAVVGLRCAAASSKINSISGLCLTKLDVLDGLETIRICVGYAEPEGWVGNIHLEYYGCNSDI